jgi:uncharacterized protein YlxW (UPF0749 family)
MEHGPDEGASRTRPHVFVAQVRKLKAEAKKLQKEAKELKREVKKVARAVSTPPSRSQLEHRPPDCVRALTAGAPVARGNGVRIGAAPRGGVSHATGARMSTHVTGKRMSRVLTDGCWDANPIPA